MANGDKTGFHVNSVTVVVAYETRNGIEEVIHQIDGKMVDIMSCDHHMERKARAVKDSNTGDIIAYEPTGEEVLTLKVKYIRG